MEDTRDPHDTTRRLYASISAGDIETLGEFFADDFVDHEENPGFGHLQLHDDREFKPDRPVRFTKRA